MGSKYEQFKQYPTQPGWYCIGWDREDQEEQQEQGPEFGGIYRFDGEDWFHEDGTEMDQVQYVLGIPHSVVKCADYYVKQ